MGYQAQQIECFSKICQVKFAFRKKLGQKTRNDDIHARNGVYKWFTGSTCWRAKRTK